MKFIRRCPLAFAALTFGLAAHAATLTATLDVSADVIPGCTDLSTTPLAFGSFTLPRNTTFDGTASVSATCGSGVAYTIDFDAGLNSFGTGPVRRLVTAGFPGNSSYLAYSLFKDAARTDFWGTGADSGTVFGGTGTGVAQVHTVYGQVNNFANASTVGTYTDTVTVTLSF